MNRTLLLGTAWTASAGAAVGLGFLAVSLVDASASPTVQPVASSALATDSVDGQRRRPSAVIRFDRLKVVGSSPDFLANPDGESPASAASRSSAVQIWACVSMA